MTLKEMLNILKINYGMSYKFIAEKTGVNYSVIRNYASGQAKTSRIGNDEKIIKFYLEWMKGREKTEQ